MIPSKIFVENFMPICVSVVAAWLYDVDNAVVTCGVRMGEILSVFFCGGLGRCGGWCDWFAGRMS